MGHHRASSRVCLITPPATRPGDVCAPEAASSHDRGGVPPDRRPLERGGPMSTSDENIYRGDAPATPPGYGAPPGYGPPVGYGPPPGYAPPPGYGQQPGYGQPGYGPPPGYPPAYGRPTNTMAILSLVLAFVFAPAGLILGIIARKQIRQTGEEGAGLALAGIIRGGVETPLFPLLIMFWILAFAALANGSFGP